MTIHIDSLRITTLLTTKPLPLGFPASSNLTGTLYQLRLYQALVNNSLSKYTDLVHKSHFSPSEGM